MIGGDELGDFSFDADVSYFDAAGVEEVDDDFLDDGIESDSVNPGLYDALTVIDGLPNLESRQR